MGNDDDGFGEKKEIVKSKPTAESKGKKVPTTTYGGLNDTAVIKKVEKKTKKAFKAGTFKKVKVVGTKTPFGLKPLKCKPAYMYATPKYLTDNTRTKSKFKPRGYAAESFLKIPRTPV
jgi:hypothetical protein